MIDYTLKTCPCCGAEHLFIEYRRDLDTIQAMYDCECSKQDRTFAAKYDFANEVRRRRAAFERSLPEDYRSYIDCELEIDAENLPAVEASMDFKRGDVLLLWGGTGRGKTHIAVQTALSTVLRDGESARFAEESRFMDEYRRAVMHSADGGASPLFDRMPTVMLIDDIAKEKATEAYSLAFFRLLEACTASRRGLILTSNDSIEVIVERLSGTTKADAIESRLRRGRIIEVVGPDRRVA